MSKVTAIKQVFWSQFKVKTSPPIKCNLVDCMLTLRKRKCTLHLRSDFPKLQKNSLKYESYQSIIQPTTFLEQAKVRFFEKTVMEAQHNFVRHFSNFPSLSIRSIGIPLIFQTPTAPFRGWTKWRNQFVKTNLHDSQQ